MTTMKLIASLLLLLASALPAQWAEACRQAGDTSPTTIEAGETPVLIQMFDMGTYVDIWAQSFAVNASISTCGDQFPDTGTYSPLFIWGFPWVNPVCSLAVPWTGASSSFDGLYIDTSTWVIVSPTSSVGGTPNPISPCTTSETIPTDFFQDIWSYWKNPSTLGMQLICQVARYDTPTSLWYLSSAWEGFLL